MVEESRIVENAEQLVFFTDTDASGYPIYVTDEREVWLKAKPHRKVTTRNEWGYEVTKRVYDIPVIATFFVREVSNTDDATHPLFEIAVNALKELSKKQPNEVKKIISYEIYRGDMEQLVGEAKAYCIILSTDTPFSGYRGEGKKAWAIGYDWVKRLKARYPQLGQYVYLKGEEGTRGRAYVNINIKLPITTADLEKLFNAAVTTTSTTTSHTGLEEQIQQLMKMIEQKRAELKQLEEQLQALQLKLQLEKMKQELL